MERGKAKLNFKELPGEIIDGVYVFPTITTSTAKGKSREWSIRVELYHSITESVYPILMDYLDYGVKISSDLIARIYKRTSQVGGKVAESDATIVTVGKNIGKSNETNVVTQALSIANNDYNKQARKNMDPSKPPPMLAKPYKDQPLDYSCLFVEPKLDGIHVVFGCTDKIYAYSRHGLVYTNLDYIGQKLKPAFERYPGIFLDGEMYMHGMPLQEISGRVRGDTSAQDLQYHIYDVFSNTPMPYVERLELRKQIVELINDPNILMVPSERVDSFAEIQAIFDRYVAQGYEGVMIKKGAAPYEFSIGGYHSDNMYKYKARESKEFTIVGFEAGRRGKDMGAIIFICATESGKTFKPMMRGWDMEQRKALYAQMQNNFSYKGQLATVEYEDLSKDGTPLRGYIVAIRNYE